MRTMIAVPCMDMVHTAFVEALLKLQPVGEIEFGITCSSLIYDARNVLAKKAIDAGCERILWLDSDMVFAPSLIRQLSADLDDGREFVTGLCFSRKNPIGPTIYKETGYTKDGRELNPFATKYLDYPKDQIFEVAACGLAACMMTTKLIQRIYAEYGAPFSPQPGFGEDLSFCIKCEQSGIPVYCDSRIKVGHVGNIIINEELYEQGVKL